MANKFNIIDRPASRVLGVAEVIATQTIGVNGFVDITGMVLNIVAPADAVWFDIDLPMANNTAGNGGLVSLLKDAVSLRTFQAVHPTANIVVPLSRKVRLVDLVEGQSYAFKLQMARFAAGTLSMAAAATDPGIFTAYTR